MFRSIKPRIVLTFVVLTTLALVAVTWMTKKNFEMEVEELHKKLLVNKLQTIMRIIQNQYEDLIKYEVENIAKRRIVMQTVSDTVLSAVRAYYDLYRREVFSETDAKRISLDWIKTIRYGKDQYFFVFDKDIIGLSHPIAEMIGEKWRGYRDLKQEDALALIRDTINIRSSGFAVFNWPALPENLSVKQMVYFTYFPEWEWIIGTSVQIEDIERDSQEKIDTIKKNLTSAISGIRFDQLEHVIVFDSYKNILLDTNVQEDAGSIVDSIIEFGHINKSLRQTLNDSDVPVDVSFYTPPNAPDNLLVCMSYFRPLDWYISVSVSESLIYKPVKKLIRREIYIIIVILIAGIILIVFFSNRITARLLLLAQYARELPSRDLSKDYPFSLARGLGRGTGEDDEVGQLIKSFNFMEERLRHTIRALTRESQVNSTMAELTESIIQSRQLEEVAALVLDRARQITESPLGFAGYIDPETSRLIVPEKASYSWDLCQFGFNRSDDPVFDPVWDSIFSNAQPFLSNSPPQKLTAMHFHEGEVPVERLLFVPALSGKTVVGQITLANAARDYTQEDLFFVERLAFIFAIAVQRTHIEESLAHSEKQLRLLSSQLVAVQEEERQRVAREMHDSIGQSLAAVKFKVESAIAHGERAENSKAFESLSAVIPIIQNAMEEVRRIYTGLRPTLLDDLGILATIEWFSREFQNTYENITVELSFDIDESEIPEALKTVIFRVVQEAFNNIARHSGAELVELSLKKKVAAIELTIEDNGEGVDLSFLGERRDPRRGLGIAGMRERTELAGGSFRIESTLGQGTIVRATWPCPAS